ncbi:hypothetical protein [Streptomyces boninensis]|uniref:hypothetical protein n=1 Tax=Streptomyces boninensis TaxID=2039455 RepID=UPI003B21FC45
MADWWSVEVFDGQSSALAWRDSYEYALVESAVTHGALMWEWHVHSWGIVLEISFREEADWERWRGLPGVQAALDAVPDPVSGLLLHRGRGGTSGSFVPRRPRPAPSAAAAELPEPEPPQTRYLLSAVDPSPIL